MIPALFTAMFVTCGIAACCGLKHVENTDENLGLFLFLAALLGLQLAGIFAVVYITFF